MLYLEATPDSSETYLSRASLATRGWSTSMIAALLDPPDRTEANPVFRGRDPMKFYAMSRIRAVEATDDFRARRDQALRRSAIARARAARRREDALEPVRAAHVSVPVLSPDKLATAAVERRNLRAAERAAALARPVDVDDVHPSTLRRWEVYFLLDHATTDSGDLFPDTAPGRVGRRAAEALWRARVCEAIGATYPDLAGEAAAQARRDLRGMRRGRRLGDGGTPAGGVPVGLEGEALAGLGLAAAGVLAREGSGEDVGTAVGSQVGGPPGDPGGEGAGTPTSAGTRQGRAGGEPVLGRARESEGTPRNRAGGSKGSTAATPADDARPPSSDDPANGDTAPRPRSDGEPGTGAPME